MTVAGTLEPWPQSLVGGSLAVDFVNTLDWRARERPVETLLSYSDLLRFAVATDGVTRLQARDLLAWSARHPSLAAQALARGRRIREDIAALFAAITRGAALPNEALARLEAACRRAWAGRRLVSTRIGARWEWAAALDPDRPAAVAALEAARLLTDPARPPLRQCRGEGCGWYFLDTSRNGRRRWCSMASCGNRAKARRFYRRSRTGTR